MKTTFLILVVFLLSSYGSVQAQIMLQAQLDYDQVMDSINLNPNNAVVRVALSTQNFQPICSKPMPGMVLKWASDKQLALTENGFRIEIDYLGANMSTRNRYYFAYDTTSQKIILIRLTSSVSGSGNSVDASLKLSNGLFQADWTLYGYNRKAQEYQRRPLPTVTDTLNVPKIHLREFNGAVFKIFEKAIGESFEKANVLNTK